MFVSDNAVIIDSGDLGDNPWVILRDTDGSYYINWTDDDDCHPLVFGPDPA